MRRLVTLPVALALAALLCQPFALPVAQAAVAGPTTVTVVKPFGAALRTAPSSNAAIGFVAACGAELRVVDSAGGWYQVSSQAGYFWVGAARVADAATTQTVDCHDAYAYQVGDQTVSYVPTGCLSLRATPSRQAAIQDCVANGHGYEIVNGPVEVAGEDWFAVDSRSTGRGWVLAQGLRPAA